MKARQTEIQITISQREGAELRNQLLALLGDSMALCSDPMRGSPLANLFELLSGNFEHSQKGVNFL